MSHKKISPKSAIYDWGHNHSVPRRIMPATPPPPRWCWGSLDDLVLKESEKSDTETEGSSVGSKDTGAESGNSEYSEYTDHNSSDSARVIEYNHGRKFLINPLFKKVRSDQKPKSESVLQDSNRVPSPIVSTDISETAPVTEEESVVSAPKDEFSSKASSTSSPNPSPSPATLGHQLTLHSDDYVKNEKEGVKVDIINIKNPVNSTTGQVRFGTRGRRLPPKRPFESSLDSIIGQKLSKVRMGTSARNYAKPPKLNKSGDEEITIKAEAEQLTKTEEGGDDDQKESLSSVQNGFLKLRSDIFEIGGS